MVITPLQYSFIVNQQKLHIGGSDWFTLTDSFQLIIRLFTDTGEN